MQVDLFHVLNGANCQDIQTDRTEEAGGRVRESSVEAWGQMREFPRKYFFTHL